ncbi:hypothetical protein HZA33_02360 [Candidatus Pacearchaeota archaeon]|nr:hypothetical protein [Candidatus Pacearchaeota archaeon]
MMKYKSKKIKLTLYINKEVLKRYKKYCESRGLIISKQVENFMGNELKKRK